MKNLITIAFILSFSFCQSQIQIGANIYGEGQSDQSGRAVSISADGKRIAIGAWQNSGAAIYAGHVRIFEEISGVWTQIGADIDGDALQDYFGHSVSISSDGKRVAIGGQGMTNKGTIRVFDEVNGNWVQVGSDIVGESAGDYFGVAVSLSADGKRFIGGAHRNGGNSSFKGHARVFEENNGAWTQVGADLDGEFQGDQSGTALSISNDGNRVAIGASKNDGFGTDAGHARVFEENNGVWTQIGVDIDGVAANDHCGTAVALSGDGKTIAVGAPNNINTTSSGHVRVFVEIGGTWTQIGMDIDGEGSGDEFGDAISISANGNVLAVGARKNAGNGSNAGHVRVFELISGAWVQAGSDIDGNTNDFLGKAVAISADGKTVAGGSHLNSDLFTYAGHTRVFQVASNSPLVLKVDVAIKLEGAYDAVTSIMKDALRTAQLIPVAEPYTALGYTHIGGGGESINPSVLSASGPDAIVDWIFLELRDALGNSTPIATRSALLQADGDVVDIDGSSEVDFSVNSLSPGTYWVVVRHRTHLDVMSANSVILDGTNPAIYDFNVSGSYGSGLKTLNNGVKVMYTGDLDQNGVVSASDRNAAWNARNQTGYISSDSTMDGVCGSMDRSVVWNNRNASSQIP